MPWTPPTEQEFNEKWVTLAEAVEAFGGSGDPRYDDYKTVTRVLERLRAGLLIAVARSGSAGAASPSPMMRIPQRAWNQDYLETNETLWEHGDVTLQFGGTTGYGDWTEFRYFDIRIDPASFNDNPRTRPEVEAETAPPLVEKLNLPRAEAERFCRAILAGWGDDVTQDWAYEKAVLFFPDKKVARDSFRSILRSMRPGVKPGKKPKIDE